uniref:Damaged DNA binding 2 n=1 Tax=Tanacetum cinerariifolium TaxID=118510 RepID=A0A6L2KF82_TANCI|nr:damaged DNA binding 2 [Tanacetum cinerariifolium]
MGVPRMPHENRLNLYLDHLDMNLSEYLSQAITIDMEASVYKKIWPLKKRYCNDFSVNEMVDWAEMEVETEGVEARTSTTEGVEARTSTTDKGKQKVSEDATEVVETRRCTIENDSEAEYESDDDSDCQSDRSVDYFSPGEEELIELRNRMKANRQAKAKAKDNQDPSMNEPNTENTVCLRIMFEVGEKYVSVAQFKECLTYYALANGFSLWYERSGEVRVVAKYGQRPHRLSDSEKGKQRKQTKYPMVAQFLEEKCGCYFQGLYYQVPNQDLERALVRVSDDRSVSYMFDVEETFGRLNLYLDHLDMNLSEYLSQAITIDMEASVYKKIWPLKKRYCNDFSVNEMVDWAEMEVETEGVEARTSTTEGVEARTSTTDKGKQKVSEDATEVVETRRCTIENDSEAEYESDDDSDCQSDRSVDYFSPGEEELIELRNRMKANRQAKAKAKDNQDPSMNEPNTENTVCLRIMFERYPMYDETTHRRLRKPKVGEKYVSVAQFKECLTYYALANGFSLWYERSGEVRVVAKYGQRPHRLSDSEKDGWKVRCRKIVALDGCFLKSPNQSEILTAIGRDGNNHIYSVAWAVRLEWLKEQQRFWHVLSAGGNLFKVRSRSEGFTVDEGKRTCTCRMWRLSGLPCVYATKVIFLINRVPESYVPAWASGSRGGATGFRGRGSVAMSRGGASGSRGGASVSRGVDGGPRGCFSVSGGDSGSKGRGVGSGSRCRGVGESKRKSVSTAGTQKRQGKKKVMTYGFAKWFGFHDEPEQTQDEPHQTQHEPVVTQDED